LVKRIVKLSFLPEKTDDFLLIFEDMKTRIRSFEGCSHLELWRSLSEPQVFFTYSIWESEIHLNAYRKSEMFQHTWKRTKALFAQPAVAWSVDTLESVNF
jgi:quinol monooxygenase YgiN